MLIMNAAASYLGCDNKSNMALPYTGTIVTLVAGGSHHSQFGTFKSYTPPSVHYIFSTTWASMFMYTPIYDWANVILDQNNFDNSRRKDRGWAVTKTEMMLRGVPSIWKGFYMHFAIRAPKCACNYMLQFYVAGNACIHGRIYMIFIHTYAPGNCIS
jgi:hypothetical protein